ncbi:MAG: MerR family DNA-binding protein, partial [Acetobacteraceae bacterium]
MGVLPRPQRTDGGRRVYGTTEVARLTFICRARELGFSLDEVRSLLKLAEEDKSRCGIARMFGVKSPISERLRRLWGLSSGECQAGEPGDCPLIEALSQPKAAAFPV